MAYDFDVLVIGLGPAGMAVAVMASEMGLSVCAVEKEHVGGECMNVGCIPSKALLRMAKARATVERLSGGLPEGCKETTPASALPSPFARIAESLDFISRHKTMGMFNKVELVYRQGAARFTGSHEVTVGGRRISARRIFICTGTSPAVPDIPGLRACAPLTNENLFQLEAVPESMLVLGSGAIACEMAQAFARLGCKVTMAFRGKGLLWREDPEVAAILEQRFEQEGVTLLRNAAMQSFSDDNGAIRLTLEDGLSVTAEKVLCALGRRFDPAPLDLGAAGVAWNTRGILVDKHLRTSQPHIYACGDVNGEYQFSHAAMHQGMLALMNCMSPLPFKRNFRRFPVPWTVFTEPQVSRVGLSLEQLAETGRKYDLVQARYGDYGAAIAEGVDTGFIKAAVTGRGHILGVTIVGEGSGEMINEWAMALQNRISLFRIMMQQHSFPTMGFLSKRVAETWMMQKMRSPKLQKLCRFLYRFGS